MTVYHFACTCELGAHGSFSSRAEAERIREALRAEGCNPGELEKQELGHGGSFGDIPEHYNHQFGEPVRGRRHFRSLQEKYNTSDYDMKKAHERQSPDWKTRWAEPSPAVTRDIPEPEGPPLVLDSHEFNALGSD